MRGIKQDRPASVIIEGHAFIQNLQRGHYDPGVDALPGMASPRPLTSSRSWSEGRVAPELASQAFDNPSMQQSPPVQSPEQNATVVDDVRSGPRQ
jgi:hypothetical protein